VVNVVPGIGAGAPRNKKGAGIECGAVVYNAARPEPVALPAPLSLWRAKASSRLQPSTEIVVRGIVTDCPQAAGR
jgi:hypothetical protein